MLAAREPLVVTSLLGHRQVEMALACLGSLLRYCAEPLRLLLHDDGSLTASDRERLEAALGGPEIRSREEADEGVADALARYPAARALRRGNPLGLKLLDVPLLAAGETLSFCDADVLFLRPFSGLFRLPGAGVGALFMSDRQNAYSVRSWHLLRHRRLRLPRRINTGIVHSRAASYDLDLLEWYLSHPAFHFAPEWAEQTAWALLGQRAGCRRVDPGQLAFPPAADDPAPGDPVAFHFVSPLRRHLTPILARSRDRSHEEPVVIRSLPARSLMPWHLALDELRRRLRRWR